MSQTNALVLSFHPIDFEFVYQLATDLKNAGLPVWLDQLDSNHIGDSERTEVLLNASGLLVVLSPEYAEAEFSRHDLQYAYTNDLPVIAVVVRPLPAKQTYAHIPAQFLLDFTHWRDERDYRARLDRLYATIKARVPAPPGSSEDAETRYLRSVIAKLTGRMGALEFLRVYRSEQQPEIMRPVSKVLPLWGTLNPMTFTDINSRISSGTASLGDALEKSPRLLVTGAPGAGKTTVVERLALDLATARLNAADDTEILPSLPLILPLTDWNEAFSAEDFIRASWSLATDPVDLAARGELVLIFDGLHETASHAEAIVQKLNAYLAGENAPTYLILTCRTDHVQRYDLEWSRVEVGTFNYDRIRQFTDAHLGDDSEPFLELLEADPRTQSLARTPAHLRAMILIYKSNPDTQLPTSVGALYKQYFPALWLLKRYGSVPLSIKFGEVQAAMGRLAVHMLDLNIPSSLLRADAIKALGGESYLREARDAGLLDTRGERVRFTTALIQEYFAASALQPIDLASRLKNAQFSDDGQRLAGHWDQVAIMMAGISSSPDAVVREVAEIDPFLAGLCLASGVEVARSIQDEIGASLMVSAQGNNQSERISAARALSAIGRRASISGLLQAMRSGSWRTRKAAAEALQTSGAPLPVRMLDGLSSWNWEPSKPAESVLRELGADAIPVLMSMLSDEDWMRRRGATWALGIIGDMAAVPGLVDMLRDPDVLVRREAVLALGKTNDIATIQYLLPLLRDVDRTVRYAAADVLVRLKDDSIPGLIDALTDEFDEVRATAVSALGTLRAVAALEPLMQMSTDTSILVRCEVAKSLGLINDPRAIATLTEQLNDYSRVPWYEMRVCDFAVEALLAIGTKEAQAAVEMWRRRADLIDSPADDDTDAAPPTLTPLERRQRFVKLTEKLSSADPEKRSKALIAMSTLGEPEGERYMLHHLRSDPDSQVRQVAAAALANIQTDQARIALRTALRDSEVVDFAKDTLISYGAFAVPSLLEALYDTEAIARSAAIEALITIGQADPEAVSDEGIFAALESMIHDSERAFGETKTIGELADDALLILRGTPEEHTILLDAVQDDQVQVGATAGTTISSSQVVTSEPLWERNDPNTIVFEPENLEEGTLPLEAVSDGIDISDTVDTPAAIDEDTIGVEPTLEETSPEFEAVLPPDDYGDYHYIRDDDNLLPLNNFRPSPPESWPDLPDLISQLESGDFVQARKAAATIRSIAYAQADLAHKARKPSTLDTPEVVSMLQETLKSDVPLAKWAAIEALAYIRNRSTTVSLLDLMRDTSWTLRLGVVRALAEIADADALPAVVEALHDDHGLIRQAACQTLGRIGSSMAVPELVKALRDEETFVRWTAATALGDIGNTDAVPNLIEATRDHSRDVRWSAAAALGKIGDPTAIDALVGLLHDKARPAGETEPIHYVAAKALYQIGVPEAMQHVRWWRQQYQR